MSGREAYWSQGEGRALPRNSEELGRAVDAAQGPADYTLIASGANALLAKGEFQTPEARQDVIGMNLWAIARLTALVAAGNTGPADALDRAVARARERGIL